MNESPTYIYVEVGDWFLLHPASLTVPKVNWQIVIFEMD
jgi:hypothetical protein